MDININNITKMYDKQTYFDQYGGSFILFIIITLVVLILISYFHTMINIQPIINDWPNQRCKPNIIPFAGFITKPDGMSATDYTAQNFNYCTQNILSNITGEALQPLTYLTNVLNSIANSIKQSIQAVRAMFDKIRTSMQTVSQEIMGRLMNIMIPLMQIIISFKDLIGKIQGSMTAGLFTLLGSYYTLKALLGAIAQFLITILIALAVMIAIFWILPFTWGAAIANTSIFVAIAIPLAIMLTFMNDVLHVNTSYSIPQLKCFDKDTLIEMNDGTFKKITDIKNGDMLKDNNIVTAKIVVDTQGSIMYKLNDVIVSDSHMVFYKNLWIKVEHHPDSCRVYNYSEKYLYCLNTTSKTICVNETIFTDWDEIFDSSLERILDNKSITISDTSDIHKYLDYGFSETTKVFLEKNVYIDINKIKIGDVLENGGKVYGIVEIDGSTIHEQFRYNLGGNKFVEGYIPDIMEDMKCLENKHKKLYNILTQKGDFIIKDQTTLDYNAAIDRFFKKQNNKLLSNNYV